MNPMIESRLAEVQKPARYTGGEVGAVSKPLSGVEMRCAFCFPDTYEIGMSCLGVQILYGLMNERPWLWCERAFAPWTDFETLLRESNQPLYALESGDALSEFDVLAFTLQYEMCYTNVINMLDLGGVPPLAAERGGAFPLVIAGGPCALNPEPLADFIDIFAIGDGEEVTPELMELLRRHKKIGSDKQTILQEAARIPGLYVPALYHVDYHPDGTVSGMTAEGDAPRSILRRVVTDLDAAYYPTHPVVPNTEIVHERAMLELFRGCIRGCRFCQAGYATRPVRQRSHATLQRQAIETCRNTGYQEIALTSLSTSDYASLEPLCDGLLEYGEPRRIGLSLPSLRADSFSGALMERVQRVRKSGLTFAPEAGTQRLRDVINKNLAEEDLLRACGTAFAGGWSGVKLYFMLGLPTETDEDVSEIPALAQRVFYHWRQTTTDRSRGVRISASVSLFVPKPHTPFQWAGMTPRPEFRRRIGIMKDAAKKQIGLSWHEPEVSYWEAVLARGDRRMGQALLRVWQLGARLDGWGEHFNPALWQQAFAETGLDPDFYALRERGEREILPWDHIETGVTREHLWSEYQNALQGKASPNCRESCAACGADRFGGQCHG